MGVSVCAGGGVCVCVSVSIEVSCNLLHFATYFLKLLVNS